MEIREQRKPLRTLRQESEMMESETTSANNHIGIALPVWLAVCERGSEGSWREEAGSVVPHSEAPT